MSARIAVRFARNFECNLDSIEAFLACADSVSIREHLPTYYLILYLRRPETIHLLAIRHQRQLSFDLSRANPAF